MSNVLIGIIGVILFIGLALAGALFLGPRFQEARVNSVASAYSASLGQVRDAISMYEVDTGSRMLASTYNTNIATLVSGRYLKAAPTNPAVPTFAYYTADPAGEGKTLPIDHVYTSAGSDAYARTVCLAIEKQAGSSDPEANMAVITDIAAALATHRRVGCFHYRDGNYYPFVRQ